jgi:membrane protein DedA with SNARE-associated domain
VIAGAVLVVALIPLMALLIRQNASVGSPPAEASLGNLVHEYGYLAGFGVIYIEESGIPLFVAGDAFLAYVGHRLPSQVPIFLVAWLGFTLAVTLGATNLYLIARRYGRRLVEHRLAGLLHLNPRTLELADKWFARWGPWALIFGRHVPGLRVPLTVAAGLLLLPYRVFAISVAISSSAWAAAFLTLGFAFGDRVEEAIRGRPFWYGAAALTILALLAGAFAWRHFIVLRRRDARFQQ